MRSLAQYYRDVKFEEGVSTITATLDGDFLGVCNIFVGDAGIIAWKKDLFKSLGYRSSTIILRTGCGCERMVEHPHSSPYYRVPLYRQSVSALASETFDQFETSHVRTFKFRGRDCNVTGCRIFEEDFL